jgi:putative glutamine amidotransferase
MQPLIIITAGEIINKDYPWTPPVYGQMHTYSDAIVRAGGIPVVVPLIEDEKLLRELYERSDGLLLSGGNDVDPKSYNAELSPQTQSIAPKRDKQELQLLKWALQDDKPTFGICRGMQMINVGLGGTLYQDIAASVATADDHQGGVNREDFKHLAHRLDVNADSQLATILKTTHIDTNSLHHQAIDNLGTGLVVTAHAEDGIVEAIELPGKRFVIGVQSHPEALEAETEPQWRKLFKAFVQKAAKA